MFSAQNTIDMEFQFRRIPKITALIESDKSLAHGTNRDIAGPIELPRTNPSR
jgi:hypothetical protein